MVDRTSNGQSDSEASGYVALPRELTAENGAKKLLIGEFCEEIEVHNPEYCGCEGNICGNYNCSSIPETLQQKVIISWPVIKNIHKKIVEHFAT
ncbi:MAG: hypothetical protein SCABRO_00157 [Candidatus Scalindua brodae]|uniref:Uncharacterized protein n=1 Tax=Candidatus Scalindua brodae TaxID=237368 RepID=A0A0B0EN72_9BACT|nr:MAG: hypothetical protein SCABRO_00157 [Candidatus Scalindua brodae]